MRECGGFQWKPVEIACRTLDEFSAFVQSRPETCVRSHIDRGVATLLDKGLALTRRFGWASVEARGSNYREDLIVGKLSSRNWALFDLLDAEMGRKPTAEILCFEEGEAFSRTVRSLYPRSICCSPATLMHRETRRPAADISNLGFADHSFDAVVLNETLHLTRFIRTALGEARRVLRPGGLILATFPFACASEGDPYPDDLESQASPPKALGWEVIGVAEQCGFSDVTMFYISDIERGIVGGDLDGVFVFRGRVPHDPRLMSGNG
jgi:hypothetical protein